MNIGVHENGNYIGVTSDMGQEAGNQIVVHIIY